MILGYFLRKNWNPPHISNPLFPTNPRLKTKVLSSPPPPPFLKFGTVFNPPTGRALVYTMCKYLNQRIRRIGE